MKNLTSKELIEKLDNDQNGFLLDVRSEEEYEESNIPNSKLLNIRDPQSFMAVSYTHLTLPTILLV